MGRSLLTATYTPTVDKDWSSDDLLDLSRTYQGACVLAAAADLDVFTELARSPREAAEVARSLGCDPRGMEVLLDALAAMGLLSKREGRYSPVGRAGELLAVGTPDSVLPMIRHQANCLRRWAQLPTVVKTGRPAEKSPSVRGPAEDTASFIGGMHVLSQPIAPGLIAGIPKPYRHVLDVGGGPGTWTTAFLRAEPGARATLFDLPDVIPLARKNLSEAGLLDRVTLAPGDFLRDPLPAGVDLAWVSAIVHQNSRGQNRQLFASIAAALLPEGRIAIRDVVMEPSRTAPPLGALFAVNMLVATEGGGTFTLEELREDLEASGFADVRPLRRDEGMHSIVQAVKRAG